MTDAPERDIPPISPPTSVPPLSVTVTKADERRPLPPLTREGRVRRAAVAISVCLSGAAPSFALAVGGFSILGLLAGVATFAIGLVLISWSRAFRRWNRSPFVRRTLTWVYSVRLLMSVAWPFVMFFDGIPGSFAISLVQTMGFADSRYGGGSDQIETISPLLTLMGPIGTFLIVIVQGVFLNLILLTGATALLVLQRLSLPRPEPLIGESFCGRCGHCVDGVPESHACPECGATGRRWPEPLTWIDGWPRPKLAIFVTAIPLVIMTVAGILLYFFEGGLP
ncbi:MAG: hypothetical protein RLZZ461_275 [Planctomycetota bacterium]